MPIYEYQCEGGHIFEVLQGINDAEVRECKYCGKRAHRVLSPANFVLKGPGFYVNDYKKKSEPARDSSSPEKPEPEKKEKESKSNIRDS
ncbi:MAG: zinc ribbon domain-containing protein [Deltaproteobacteria bacterium]|nr:zinc ribbon domain-containing protein [Deltaproteobacteria bacterium]MBW2121761.1 zinc ribbon domain-containing protein [Deltaproteobacteria bacterium]